MSAHDRVIFHIDEAGPAMCVDVRACTQGTDAAHFANYREAARVFEAEVESEAATLPMPTATFDDLLVAQEEDLEIELHALASDFYGGSGFFIDQTGDRHRALWFVNHVEHVAEVLPDDLARLLALRAQPSAEIDEVVAPYRSDATRERYEEYIDSQLRGSADLMKLVSTIATTEARAKSFARAQERGIAVPVAVSAAFERIWNADAFTVGSRLFMENELRTAVHDRAALLASPDRQSFAEKQGYADAKRMLLTCDVTIARFRRHYPARGRNNRETVAAVVEALGLFPDLPDLSTAS